MPQRETFSRWGVFFQKPEKATETVAGSAEAEGWQKNKTQKKRCHRQPSTGPNCCQYVCNANKLYLIKGTRVTQRGHTASAAPSREHLHLRDRHGIPLPLFHTLYVCIFLGRQQLPHIDDEALEMLLMSHFAFDDSTASSMRACLYERSHPCARMGVCA